MKIAPFFQTGSTLANLVWRTLKAEFLDQLTEPFIPHLVYTKEGPQREKLIEESPNLCVIFLEGSGDSTLRQARDLDEAIRTFLPDCGLLWVTAKPLQSKDFAFLGQLPRSWLININNTKDPWWALISQIRKFAKT